MSESPFSTSWIAVIVTVIIVVPTLVAPAAFWIEQKLAHRLPPGLKFKD